MLTPARILVLLATFLLSTKSQEHYFSKDFEVTYELEYPEGSCKPEGLSPPSAMKFKVPRGSSALFVMERAAYKNREYRFTTTYFGSEIGYYVDGINQVKNQGDCSWKLYVVPQKGLKPRWVDSGASEYLISNNKSRIVLRYEGPPESEKPKNKEREASRSPHTFGVKYRVMYPDPKCLRSENDMDEFPDSYISVRRGSSGIDLLEQVKDEYPQSSTFTMTYYENYEGKNIAYFVDAFNDNMQTPYCFWAFLYEPPGGYAYLVKVGLGNFVIPEHGGRVVLRFQTSGYSGMLEPEDAIDAVTENSDKEQSSSDEAEDTSDQGTSEKDEL